MAQDKPKKKRTTVAYNNSKKIPRAGRIWRTKDARRKELIKQGRAASIPAKKKKVSSKMRKRILGKKK